jgi:hypothetical protein
MSLMQTEVYDAFRAANVPEEQARTAASALAGYSTPRTETRLRILEWMVGTNIVLTIAVLALLGNLYGKLIDLATRLGH